MSEQLDARRDLSPICTPARLEKQRADNKQLQEEVSSLRRQLEQRNRQLNRRDAKIHQKAAKLKQKDDQIKELKRHLAAAKASQQQ